MCVVNTGVLCLSIYAGTLVMGNARGDVTIRALYRYPRRARFSSSSSS